MSGGRYGRLVAVRRVGTRHRQAVWQFQCDCGVVVERLLGNVRQGYTGSCGCLGLEALVARSVSHGATRGGKPSPEWKAWKGMRDRCLVPTHAAYSRYGGRGITVCEQWKESFESFLADMGPRPPGLTLDRVDNDRGYEPGNCRWATTADQNRNKSDTLAIEDGGERLTLRAFAAKHGANASSIGSRMKSRGETAHEALRALIASPRTAHLR